MVKLIVCLLAFFVSCCATENKTYVINSSVYPAHYDYFSPELHQYVYTFDMYAKKYNKSNSAVVSEVLLLDYPDTPTTEGTAAICLRWKENKKSIYVKPRIWFNLSEIGKLGLILHEFGHCSLGLKHEESKFDINGRKIKTLMHPVLLTEGALKRDWEFLVALLFTEGR